MKNSLKNYKKFKKTPLLISVALLVFFCSVFFLLYKQIANNNIISKEAQTQWQNEATRREEIRSLDRSIKIIEGERTLIESHFAYSSNVVPFLDTVEKLALSVKAKAEIASVDVTKEKKGLSVVIKVSGNFESIYKFLTLLENSPYELEFVSANIQNISRETSSGWEAVFKVLLLSFIQ